MDDSHIPLDPHQTPRPRLYSVRNKQDIVKQQSLVHPSGAFKCTTTGISEESEKDEEHHDPPANRKQTLSKKKKRRSNQPSSLPDMEASLSDSEDYTQRSQTGGSDEDSYKQGKSRSQKRSLKKKRRHSRANEPTTTHHTSDQQSGHSSDDESGHFQPGKTENNMLHPTSYRVPVHDENGEGFVSGSESFFPKSEPVSAASRSHSEDELLADEPVKTKRPISSDLLTSALFYAKNNKGQMSTLQINQKVARYPTTPQIMHDANEQEKNESQGTLSITVTVDDLSRKESHDGLQDDSRSSILNSAIRKGQDELKTNLKSRDSYPANTGGEHNSQCPQSTTSSTLKETQDRDEHQTKSQPTSVYSANTTEEYESQETFQQTSANLLKGEKQTDSQLNCFEKTFLKPLFISTRIPQGMPPPAANIEQNYLKTLPQPILPTSLLIFPSDLPGPVDTSELVQPISKDD